MVVVDVPHVTAAWCRRVGAADSTPDAVQVRVAICEPKSFKSTEESMSLLSYPIRVIAQSLSVLSLSMQHRFTLFSEMLESTICAESKVVASSRCIGVRIAASLAGSIPTWRTICSRSCSSIILALPRFSSRSHPAGLALWSPADIRLSFYQVRTVLGIALSQHDPILGSQSNEA